MDVGVCGGREQGEGGRDRGREGRHGNIMVIAMHSESHGPNLSSGPWKTLYSQSTFLPPGV